ncbi:hypothetical protein, partial [Zymomonas mobilis]|uniref:hypothetical protein n=1 Tax=Zymomonas mobilis TaxID=542 RepID=UPI0039EC22C1
TLNSILQSIWDFYFLHFILNKKTLISKSRYSGKSYLHFSCCQKNFLFQSPRETTEELSLGWKSCAKRRQFVRFKKSL